MESKNKNKKIEMFPLEFEISEDKQDCFIYLKDSTIIVNLKKK